MAVWLLLSGQPEPLYVGSGVLASLFITCVAARMGIAGRARMPMDVGRTVTRYWPWLLYKIVVANLDVAYRVWHPRLPISPRFLRVRSALASDIGAATYANSITLTPGTVSVAAERERLLVHALTEEGARELMTGEMHDKVRSLERTG
jgi:multicomponent Na+:H+ antiporter subunit E